MSFLSPYACSLHLFISSATYHRCLNEACPSCDPGCVRNPQSLAISVVLWFCDPVILRSWVCEKPWDSSCFCNPEILLWPSSWDAMILGVLQHLWVKLILDALGPGVELAPKVYTGQLTLEGTCATSQAGVPEFLDPIGPSYSWCWDRCCGLLTYDPGSLRAPGSQVFSGCCGTGWGVNAHCLLRAISQTRKIILLTLKLIIHTKIPLAQSHKENRNLR